MDKRGMELKGFKGLVFALSNTYIKFSCLMNFSFNKPVKRKTRSFNI